MESRQLTFAFADSPKGGGKDSPSDESGGLAQLLRIAKDTPTSDSSAEVTDTSRLFGLGSEGSILNGRSPSKEPDVWPTSPVL